MRYSQLLLSLYFICLSVLKGFSQEGTELITATDMLKIKSISSVAVSPNGTTAAFLVNSIVPDDSNRLDYRYVNQIYIAPVNGSSAPVQLTTSKEGAQQLKWSPDGSRIAFVRSVNGKAQIFILSMSGGEPKQVTRAKYGASNPKWSPDGKQLLFSSGITLQEYLKDTVLNATSALPSWPSEKPGITAKEYHQARMAKPNPDGTLPEVRSYLNRNEADRKAIVLNKLNFQNELNLSSDITFNQFYLLNLNTESTPVSVTKGFYRFNNADFTPDGKQIIFSGEIDSLEHPDRSLESEIFITDINGNNLRKLLSETGKTFTGATVSPSGKWLAFLQNKTSFVSIPALSLMPLTGSAKDIITIPYDRDKSNLTWSKDDKYLYFTSNSNGGVILNRLNVATKKIDRLSDFDAGISSFDFTNNGFVYTKTQVSNPSELYVADSDMRNEKQVSRFNDWVKNKKISFPEKRTFRNEKGLEVEYWIMKPANFRQGQKYPLLLEIHGGPSAMWGPGERSMWHEFQYFASQGYGVVYSNPRGSGGYGQEFLRANINDWGAGPASDVLTALDKTVADGWADTAKLLITGGSYAGYLTAWIISHDQRFAAACSQRGVYDLSTFFGEGNAWRLVPNYFGGYPWEPKVREILFRESPINYVQNIHTPYIIFHGANDRRTGFVQAEMMYRSLKVLNRPVEFVVHPGASHEITRAGDNRQRIDQLVRTYEFFERWIKK